MGQIYRSVAMLTLLAVICLPLLRGLDLEEFESLGLCFKGNLVYDWPWALS